MSARRKDNRGRVLHNGESQMADGRYRYRYKDSSGKTCCFYSWRLDHNSPTPPGKKRTLSLREMEKQLQKDQFDNVAFKGGNLTVLELVEKYIQTKPGVRNTTRAGYNTVINFLKKDPFGKKQIDTVRVSDAKIWLIGLQQKKGKSYSAIHSIRGVLRPAFQLAVDDDLIRRNPFRFELASVIINDSVRRDAITKEQERKFLEFIRTDKHFCRYYEGIFILFKTGLRISEFTGLTIDNVDFKNHKLIVDHQLQRSNQMEYIIEEPKTKSGIRAIPMTKEVEEAFRTIIRNRRKPRREPKVNGYSGFLYLDKNENPMVALHWEKYFKHIVEKYNRIYKDEMPTITPHVCRHTFCSNMAKGGMNPKSLQYIMGHSDISVTLNTYTHVNYEDAAKEMEKLTCVN